MFDGCFCNISGAASTRKAGQHVTFEEPSPTDSGASDGGHIRSTPYEHVPSYGALELLCAHALLVRAGHSSCHNVVAWQYNASHPSTDDYRPATAVNITAEPFGGITVTTY